MDEAMMDPTQSIMWSPQFLGNGNGLVTTGPFAFWQTPSGPLIRGIGGNGGGSLLSRDEIFRILSRTRLAEISEPNADDMFNFEDIHGDVHTWLGGEMEPMETSAFDPLFYMHHAFVDYVWEIFQTRQRQMGIDPTRDYPQDFGGPTHAPFARMGFGDLTTSFGLGDFFTRRIYRYQQNPSCSRVSPSCGSNYLQCDMSQGVAQCLPIATGVNNAAPIPPTQQFPGGPMRAPTGGMVQGRGPMGAPPVGGFAMPPPVFGRRRRRQTRIELHSDLQANIGNNKTELHTVISSGASCATSWLSFSSQNTFEVNGVSDTRKWVFIPIRIISKRSPEHRKFNAFPIFDGHASKTHDIYNPESYPEISPYFSEFVMPSSPTCAVRGDGDRTVGKVHIKSNGLNYHGSYEEYVVVDLRQAFAESTTYLALRDPKESVSEAFVAAYDSCGRRCKPYCLYKDQKTGKEAYRSCSGAIEVTNESPWMYGKNYGDAVRISWAMHAINEIPVMKTDSVFLQFYCDHTDG